MPLRPTQPSNQRNEAGSVLVLRSNEERNAKVITSMRATHVSVGMRRIPLGFYASIAFNGLEWRTASKRVEVNNDVIEWNDVISLPLNLSDIVRVGIYASFEFSPMLGKGELLRGVETTVRELLDGFGITFLPRDGQLPSSCSSLVITVAERDYERCNPKAVLHIQSSDPDEIRLENATDLAHRSLLCFQEFGDKQWLKRAIEEFEHAFYICPLDHPYRPPVLSNLAMARFIGCQVHLTHVDFDVSISLYQQVRRLRPAGHPDLPATLLHLAIVLLARFQDRRYLDDAFIASELLGRVLEYSPVESYEYQSAVVVTEMHLAHLAADNRNVRWSRPVELVEQGYVVDFFRSFQNSGDLLNLEIGISLSEAYAESSVARTPEYPAHLVNLSSGLLHRFERNGDLADLNKAISRLREALPLLPDEHRYRGSCLNNLGIFFTTRFHLLGQHEDLDQSISSFQNAVRLPIENKSTLAEWLTGLGISLRIRFENFGDIRDLDLAILRQEEAVRLIPEEGSRRAGFLNNLGTSLRQRFDYLGDVNDLHQAIFRQEEAVRIIQLGHHHWAACLNNLGNSLETRFDLAGDPNDLDRAISVKEEVVRHTPEGHQNRPRWLHSLGMSLGTRFDRTGDPGDVEQAILRVDEAVRLTKDSSPDRAKSLNSLGKAFASRFARFGDLRDLDKSLSKFEDAVLCTPDGHPSKPLYLLNLGRIYFQQFMHTDSHSALQNALTTFSNAARTSTGSSVTRFEASRRWIECARRLGDDTLLEAYSVAIDMLPQLAWIGLPLRDRQLRLLEAAETVRDAASTALELGRPATAVEWLEQGRSVVWSELLQLRTPLDELRAEHPVLADRLRQVSNSLEQASAREQPRDIGMKKVREPSLEEQARQHRELALEREKILEEVRSLPGFKRFLLGKTIGQLSDSARSGPVVILNASHRRCDALILVSGVDEVLHVPLPNITFSQAEDLQKALDKLLLYGGRDLSDGVSQMSVSDTIQDEVHRSLAELLGYSVRDVFADGRAARPARRSNDAWFREILFALWTKVVKPVLTALRFSNPGELRRIFWCPTGPFSFLPIHAAGQYDTTKPGSKLSDFAISSYTPTLSALAPPQVQDATKSIRVLTVRQPNSDGQSRLPGTQTELEHIHAALDSHPSPHVSIVESKGTVEDVLEKMKTSDWVHFACHGVQDLANPLDSGLLLADRRRLKLSDIIQLSRAPGGLAFLSACQTATGDRELSEEAVHLAAGMLLAGYGSVIATMWSIGDRDAPEVAKDVYEELFQRHGVPDHGESARALHHAVQRLRDRRKTPFLSWVPFIHIGL